MLKTKFHTTKLYIIIRYSKGFRPLKPRRERVGIKLGNLGKILGNFGCSSAVFWEITQKELLIVCNLFFFC